IWFGSLVDRYRKKTVMQVSAAISLAVYAGCLVLYLLTPKGEYRDVTSVWLWLLIVLLMTGVIAGNIRGIALSTLVTALISEDRRDRANGLVGTTMGISFLATSVISGLLVGFGGMFYVLVMAVSVLAAAFVHLAVIPVPVPPAAPTQQAVGSAAPHAPGAPEAKEQAATLIDLRGTLRIVRGVPGLVALIAFGCFNNLLGGVFMSLGDPYGLSLMSVQSWGLLWGVLSTAFILGGLLVARTGLTPNPLRLLLVVNLVLWSVNCLFPLRSSIVVLAVGLYAYMLLMPYAEAAEQTILQKVVPYERQGRVFGFAQSVEQAASPAMAFLIGPITQFIFIPWMSAGGGGAELIGGWFGSGPDRGMALVFVLSGVIGLVVTALALGSRHYRALRARLAEPGDAVESTAEPTQVLQSPA
ncbi:MAG TPA: MFS transporter, partial [Propionibacteriaceae bacterium]|nr:MFS transporter [Propionibacteriaceae bacterium]